MHNGLLLAAHLDIAFDQGFLTVAEDGAVLASHNLPTSEREVLGLGEGLRISKVLMQFG